jgi:hypothetical protein
MLHLPICPAWLRGGRLCYTFAFAPLCQLRAPSQLTHPQLKAGVHPCALASETNAITNADVPRGTVYTIVMLHFCDCAAWLHSVTAVELPRFVRVGRLCYTFAFAPLAVGVSRLCYTFALAPLAGVAHERLPTSVTKCPNPNSPVASGETLIETPESGEYASISIRIITNESNGIFDGQSG